MVVALPDQQRFASTAQRTCGNGWWRASLGRLASFAACGSARICLSYRFTMGGKAVYDTYLKRPASRWVLNVNVNPGGPVRVRRPIFYGQVRRIQFVEDHPYSGPHWSDCGKDFYASTSFSNTAVGSDGIPERTWIAWMSDWEYADKLPSLPGRGEMTVARHLYLRQPHGPAPTPAQEPLLLVQEPILPGPAHKPYGAMFGAPKFQSIALANAGIAGKKLPGSATGCGLTLRRETLLNRECGCGGVLRIRRVGLRKRP